MGLSLRNRCFLAAAAFVVLVALIRCSGAGEEADKKHADNAETCKAPINPNGSSELSLLMRRMQSSLAEARELIVQGKALDKFPEEFKKIHSAKPTDLETKKPSFTHFADFYLESLSTLYNSSPQELQANYNAVVNACASCHTEHCPGPLKAIHKLKLVN